MKHLGLLIFSGISFFLIIAARCVQLLFLTDSNNGFFIDGYEGIGAAITVFTAVLTIICAFSIFFFKKEKIDPIPASSIPLGCAAILLGVSNIIEPFINKIEIVAIPTVILTLRFIFIILSGIVFIMFGFSVILEKNPKFELSVIWVISWVLRLMTTFIGFSGMSNISENLYDVLMLVASLIFMLFFSKAICGILKSTHYRKLIATGISAVLFTASSAIPCLITTLFINTKFIHTPIDSPVTGIFTSLFIFLYLLNICKVDKAV